MLVGLKLVITNGYCYENKKKEIVVSDGKFDKVTTEIELNYIKELNSEKIEVRRKILDGLASLEPAGSGKEGLATPGCAGAV